MRLILTVGTSKTSGGTGVLLSIINFAKELGIDIYIYCLEPYISEAWLERHPEIAHIQCNDIQQTDVLIVSEEFIFVAIDLSKHTTKYIVLNQGLNSSLVSDFKRNTYSVTKLLYQGALGVIVNSEHTAEGVQKVFEVATDKIHRYFIPVNELFKSAPKQNIITYMPRRNRVFGCFVVNYLSGKYLDYDFIPIDNMQTDEVAGLLGKSKFFLSFGGPEGLGLPPLEAAMSKCIVIGHDGDGGKEYFNKPIFNTVRFHDHLGFVETASSIIEQGYQWSENEQQQLDVLKAQYNMDNARKSFYNIMNTILGEKNG